MKQFILLSTFFVVIILSCVPERKENKINGPEYFSRQRSLISYMLDSLNIAAANADFNLYFSFYADSSRFIGTDATENWDKDSFMNWAKPYFEKKKTWNFRSLERHIFFGNDTNTAWFDELLETKMKICRGSGVVIKSNGRWLIEQYVLSMTVPNSKTSDVVNLKSEVEDSIISKIKSGLE